MAQKMRKRSLRELSAELGERMDEEVNDLEAAKEDVEKKRLALQEEKTKMAIFKTRKEASQDLIEINVGGEVMSTKRGTLLLADSTLLEAMFSGRWEESLDRDSSRRVFLDFSPDVFRILLGHLRVMRDAPPDQIVKPPVVPPVSQAQFDSMIDFLEVRTFIFGSRQHVPKDLVIASPHTAGTLDVRDAYIRNNAPANHHAIVGLKPLMVDSSSQPPVWKVVVEKLPHNGWFCAGVIADSSPAASSFNDGTCFAWAGGKQVYCAGVNQGAAGGWETWGEGDEAIFKLDRDSRTLRMHVRQKLYQVSLGNVLIESLRLHFNVHAVGTEVRVMDVSLEEATLV